MNIGIYVHTHSEIYIYIYLFSIHHFCIILPFCPLVHDQLPIEATSAGPEVGYIVTEEVDPPECSAMWRKPTAAENGPRIGLDIAGYFRRIMECLGQAPNEPYRFVHIQVCINIYICVCVYVYIYIYMYI